MFLPQSLQLEVFWNTRNEPRDETGDEIDGKLEHEHESEASSNHFPVLLGDLIRPNWFMIARVPEIWKRITLQTLFQKSEL